MSITNVRIVVHPPWQAIHPSGKTRVRESWGSPCRRQHAQSNQSFAPTWTAIDPREGTLTFSEPPETVSLEQCVSARSFIG